MKEEHDLAVQKRAILLVKKLFVFINSADNTPAVDLKSNSESLPCQNSIDENLENCTKRLRQIDSSDRILNSITTASDCELLPNLKSDNSNNIYPTDVFLHQKTESFVPIQDFVNFVSTYDFDDYDAKAQWVLSTRSGLDSMLDDIIGQSQNCIVEGADLLDCH